MWMGPGRRKRSLLLSLPKQSAAASRSAIRRRYLSMQMTITKTRGNVLPPRALSNLPFDGCNAFRLDGRVVTKSGQPMHIRFSPEPCDLALGIVTMCLLRRNERRLPIHFAAQELYRLLVSERRQRAGLFAVFCEKPFRLGDQFLVKHLRGPLVDTCIKSFTIRIESETQNAKAAQRFASLLPKLGHSPARGPARGRARGQTHLNRADHLGNVIGVNAVGRRSIEPSQDAMQVLGPVFLRATAQFVAQIFGPLRAREKSLEQSAQIESGSSADDGQVSSLLAFA